MTPLQSIIFLVVFYVAVYFLVKYKLLAGIQK